MSVCENFEYPALLQYFEEISAIPRGTYNEGKIADYIVKFALDRGLYCYRDEFNNVFVVKEATEGCEGRAPILLQGHTDMVCEKNSATEHDFMRDPLKLYVDNGWLKAKGTTLGADNGDAVAVMLALLDGGAVKHPRLECLFTASEEVGLDGAKNFDYSKISARRMINMDGAGDGIIIAGCAGGMRSSLSFNTDTEKSHGDAYALNVSGLAGGHSGEDIHESRQNAIKLMGRILLTLISDGIQLRLVSACGGSKDNAIPREAEAVIAVDGVSETELSERLSQIEKEIQNELSLLDRDFCIELTKSKAQVSFTAEATKKTVFMLASIANGVLLQSTAVSGTVDYSRNLGRISTEYNESGARVELVFLTRSAVESRIDASACELDSWAELFCGASKHYNRYPGWAFARSSEIRDIYASVYEQVCGTKAETVVLHAGLECGIVSKAIPEMDIISCGPAVINLHSPDEAMELDSFARFYKVIKTVVEDH